MDKKKVYQEREEKKSSKWVKIEIQMIVLREETGPSPPFANVHHYWKRRFRGQSSYCGDKAYITITWRSESHLTVCLFIITACHMRVCRYHNSIQPSPISEKFFDVLCGVIRIVFSEGKELFVSVTYIFYTRHILTPINSQLHASNQ